MDIRIWRGSRGVVDSDQANYWIYDKDQPQDHEKKMKSEINKTSLAQMADSNFVDDVYQNMKRFDKVVYGQTMNYKILGDLSIPRQGDIVYHFYERMTIDQIKAVHSKALRARKRLKFLKDERRYLPVFSGHGSLYRFDQGNVDIFEELAPKEENLMTWEEAENKGYDWISMADTIGGRSGIVNVSKYLRRGDWKENHPTCPSCLVSSL